MKRLNKTILIIVISVVALIATISLTSEAKTTFSYAEKPIISILGDSISSYYGYGEPIVYYSPADVPGSEAHMAEKDTYWRSYADNNDYKMGWNCAMGFAMASIDESEEHSFSNTRRIHRLANAGTPDYIAIYGGTCDLTVNHIGTNDFDKGYNRLVNKIHSIFPDVRLIHIGLGYFLPEYPAGVGTETIVDGYNDSISKIAKDNNDYYVDLRGVLEDKRYFDSSYTHPNEEGMALLSSTIASSLAESRGHCGIESITLNKDSGKYVVKVNAYDDNYDNLRFKMKLVNSNSGEVIYDTSWQKENCFILDGVDSNSTYEATAWIDNNSDGSKEATLSQSFSNLDNDFPTTIYNGVDYREIYDFNFYIWNSQELYYIFADNPMGALEHFVNNGMREGRQAKAEFDVASYRNRYADLRQAFGWDNLEAYYNHYLYYGINEGRDGTLCYKVINPVHTYLGTDFSAVYDYEFYKNNNPDLVNAFGENDVLLFGHYLNNGLHEGRQASPNFNLWTYIGNYEDLRNAFGFNLPLYVIHYINYGQYEGRTAV